jgi:hypothetical protein
MPECRVVGCTGRLKFHATKERAGFYDGRSADGVERIGVDIAAVNA